MPRTDPPRKDLPLPTLGADVIGQEGSLPEGTVRRAHNVVIDSTGGFARRPGYSLVIALENAHSLYRNPDWVLVAAGTKLYTLNLAQGTKEPIFEGLTVEAPVSYCEAANDTYFCSPGVLGKITRSGLVRRPGVAQLLGFRPTLTATVGGLLPGRYGVAYSLINDLGEESAISSIEWIDLAGGGILLSGLQTASDVARMNIYTTTPNGSELYLHGSRVQAGTATILDQTLSRQATKQYLEPMPGGSIVRFFHGRLYVADGPWLWVSEPFDYGLTSVKSGYMIFDRPITMLEAVEGGIFVGMSDRVVFLQGDGPGGFRNTVAATRGAIPYSGTTAPADYFNDLVAPDRGKACAAWLSEVGLAVGRPDGSVSFPQAQRVRVVGDRARAAFVEHDGIKQAVFCGATMGTGAIDQTI